MVSLLIRGKSFLRWLGQVGVLLGVLVLLPYVLAFSGSQMRQKFGVVIGTPAPSPICVVQYIYCLQAPRIVRFGRTYAVQVDDFARRKNCLVASLNSFLVIAPPRNHIAKAHQPRFTRCYRRQLPVPEMTFANRFIPCDGHLQMLDHTLARWFSAVVFNWQIQKPLFINQGTAHVERQIGCFGLPSKVVSLHRETSQDPSADYQANREEHHRAVYVGYFLYCLGGLLVILGIWIGGTTERSVLAFILFIAGCLIAQLLALPLVVR